MKEKSSVNHGKIRKDGAKSSFLYGKRFFSCKNPAVSGKNPGIGNKMPFNEYLPAKLMKNYEEISRILLIFFTFMEYDGK